MCRSLTLHKNQQGKYLMDREFRMQKEHIIHQKSNGQKREAGVDCRALSFVCYLAALCPTFHVLRPQEAFRAASEPPSCKGIKTQTDYRITWFYNLYFCSGFIPSWVHTQYIFTFYLLLNSLITLVGGCLFPIRGFRWQFKAFSFGSQKITWSWFKRSWGPTSETPIQWLQEWSEMQVFFKAAWPHHPPLGNSDTVNSGATLGAQHRQTLNSNPGPAIH